METEKSDINSSIHNLHEQLTAKRQMTFARVKSAFLMGVLVTIPFILTLWAAWFIFDKLTVWSINLINAMTPNYELGSPERICIRIISLLAVLIILFFVGVFTKLTLGKKLLQLLQWILSKIPVVNFLYNTVRQIADTIWKQQSGKMGGQRVVLCEYPRMGSYSIGLVMNENTDDNELCRKTGKDLLSVFIPTTPNPTSGYLLYLPREDCIPLDMDTATAMRLIISCGALPINEKSEKLPDQSAEKNDNNK